MFELASEAEDECETGWTRCGMQANQSIISPSVSESVSQSWSALRWRVFLLEVSFIADARRHVALLGFLHGHGLPWHISFCGSLSFVMALPVQSAIRLNRALNFNYAHAACPASAELPISRSDSGLGETVSSFHGEWNILILPALDQSAVAPPPSSPTRPHCSSSDLFSLSAAKVDTALPLER